MAGSALAGLLILPGRGFTPAHGYASLTAGADIRAVVGAVLYLTLIALLSLGVAAAVRDSAVAIGLVLGLLYLFPIVASLVSHVTLARRLQQIGPLSVGLDVQATIGVKSLPLTPWQGLGVVALWTVGALLLGALALKLLLRPWPPQSAGLSLSPEVPHGHQVSVRCPNVRDTGVHDC